MPKKKEAGVSKTAFVKSLPSDMPAKEVVAKAKGQGLAISEKYVYVIRSISKKGAAKAGRATASPAKRGRPAQAAAPSNGSSESRFVDLVLEIGLGNAQDLVNQIRSRVSELIA